MSPAERICPLRFQEATCFTARLRTGLSCTSKIAIQNPYVNCTFRGVQEASWGAQGEPRGAQEAFRNMQDGSWGDQGRVPGRPGHVPGVWNASRDEKGSVLFLPERVSYALGHRGWI